MHRFLMLDGDQFRLRAKNSVLEILNSTLRGVTRLGGLSTGYWRSLTLLNARGRAAARLAELVELMLLMSSSSSIRPALERVREPLRREKNISEKIFRKKNLYFEIF